MQIYVMSQNPKEAVRLIENKKLKMQLTNEFLQMYSTYFHNVGINRDYFCKPIKQGKELVHWIGDNLGYANEYLLALFEDYLSTFGIEAQSHLKYVRMKKFVENSLVPTDISTRLNYVSFRCKESYPLYDKLNKQKLNVADGIYEYTKYYKWNIAKFK